MVKQPTELCNIYNYIVGMHAAEQNNNNYYMFLVQPPTQSNNIIGN